MNQDAQELKVGDVVELQSGSPRMTIRMIKDHTKTSASQVPQKDALCTWFVGLKQEVGWFSTLCLVRSDPILTKADRNEPV